MDAMERSVKFQQQQYAEYQQKAAEGGATEIGGMASTAVPTMDHNDDREPGTAPGTVSAANAATSREVGRTTRAAPTGTASAASKADSEMPTRANAARRESATADSPSA